MFSSFHTASRRHFLAAVAALGVLVLGSRASGQTQRFSRQIVIDAAQDLAEQAFSLPPPVSDALLALDYDKYRSIRYRKKAAIWGNTPTRFSIELFAPGNLYGSGVDISVVENGEAFPVPVRSDTFEAQTPEIAKLVATVGQVAGFRLHYPLNRDDYEDEFVVFQGASYFRAVSQGQSYGLSARGLAIDVAEASGEEFPIFRKFWIERPSSRADSIVVHALLDSPSVAGAYRFGIYPDTPTRMDVDVTLFARRPLRHIGLGALTSMYLFGSMDATSRPDYRSAVHDSNGLAMHTGAGEYLWRPLNNPDDLQVSAFMDENPKGFGLIQRNRKLEDFQDLEANYQSRPSAWVSPRGNWGKGHVALVEIPTRAETNDNIVAYWRPRLPVLPGMPFSFAYQLSWPDDRQLPDAIARVQRSAYGLMLGGQYPQMVIDYVGLPAGVLLQDIDFEVGFSKGSLIEIIVQPGGFHGARVFVSFDAGGATATEIRLQPKFKGAAIGETWLYRWLAA
ncbi:MAG: glucan biosynthesis protein G [Pseudomonadales bacterium]|nr:glucan biosynthesis protein G [Pseudomonadales bacterium]